MDEKTGIQALERTTADLLPQKGKHRRREFNYIRHGTQVLLASTDLSSGKVYAQVRQQRTEQDTVEYMQYVFDQIEHDKSIIVIADQLNTHKSESMVRLVHQYNGEEFYLGEKGKSGTLKNMKTRMEYLEADDFERRIRFVFTPKHCSWLNVIETFFATLSKRILQFGDFSSTEDLKCKIEKYIDYHNEQFAKKYNCKVVNDHQIKEILGKVMKSRTKLTG